MKVRAALILALVVFVAAPLAAEAEPAGTVMGRP